MVLSCFFKVLTKTAGNRRSKTGERKHKEIQRLSYLAQRKAKYPALPEEIQRLYKLAEIKVATNNFDKNLIIGKGGFGNVYKGILNDGNLVIAVKRLSFYTFSGLNEYQTEAVLLSQLRHPHLVSLRGFCCEDDEMILVYEYMSNGSLNDHLHYGTNNDPIPWKKRLQICIGVARGLHYLHIGAKQTIIHCHIMSSNILLDDNWDCKLSDFGLSQLRSRNKSKSLKTLESRITGTMGYMDPMYAMYGELSEKSDVYSFGVVLFEVLCARRASEVLFAREYEIRLVDWARKCIEGRTIHNIIDPYLMGKIAPECFKIFVDIAFCCTNEEENSRPDMGEVEVMLELVLEMQEKADSDTSPHAEYELEQVSFTDLVPNQSSNAGPF